MMDRNGILFEGLGLNGLGSVGSGLEAQLSTSLFIAWYYRISLAVENSVDLPVVIPLFFAPRMSSHRVIAVRQSDATKENKHGFPKRIVVIRYRENARWQNDKKKRFQANQQHLRSSIALTL
jgi:hypothetical protein